MLTAVLDVVRNLLPFFDCGTQKETKTVQVHRQEPDTCNSRKSRLPPTLTAILMGDLWFEAVVREQFY